MAAKDTKKPDATAPARQTPKKPAKPAGATAQAKQTPKKPAKQAAKKPSATTQARQTPKKQAKPAGDPMERMEAMLREGMAGLAAGLSALSPGAQAAPAGGAGGQLAARLTQLEEHFARICMVVGRLDQEVQLLKDALAGGGSARGR